MKTTIAILFKLIAFAASAQPLIILPPPPPPHTNYFVVTATDDTGESSDWSNEASSSNLPPYLITWDAAPGWYDGIGTFHLITNYTVRWSRISMTETNDRCTINVGTNCQTIWPPVRAPSNIVIRVSSQLIRTNPVDGPKFFALFESSDLQQWKIARDAKNEVSVTP